jgi:hypothetical protein
MAWTDAQVQDEALTDTLLDLANYAVLAILALEAPGGSGCKCGNGVCHGEENGHPQS